MKEGSSVRYPELMEKVVGEKALNAQAMLDYFKPLETYLDEQLTGKGGSIASQISKDEQISK